MFVDSLPIVILDREDVGFGVEEADGPGSMKLTNYYYWYLKK